MKYINFVLSLLALALAFLIGVNAVVARNNNALSNQLYSDQQILAASQTYEAELRNLTLHVAQGALKDSALRDLLVKHELKATIDVNGQPKEVP